MDNFYRDESIELFQKWVYYKVKSDERLKLEEVDSHTYRIYYDNKIASFVVWPIGVIEESIYENEELLFYLHYQFYNFHFASDLFYRMIDKLTQQQYHKKRKILLCCTGGMTTSYFAEKINKYCSLNKLMYEVNATAAYRLDEFYKDYEMILIAPQLRYKVIELSKKYKPTIVQSIEPVTFASYDCQQLIQQVEDIEKEYHL